MTIQQTTRVLPGHRVEVVVPELQVGQLISVVVEPIEASSRRIDSIVQFLDSLPDGPRAFPDWKKYERYLRQEREVWDD